MLLIRRLLVAIVLFIAIALIVLKVLYGGGKLYPNISTEPLILSAQVTPLVTLPYPPGNVTTSPEGRIFFAYHPFGQVARFNEPTVFELVDGKPQPYPDAESQASYQGVFGMTVDQQQRLWMIEPASLDHAQSKLIAYDLETNQRTFEFAFPNKDAQFGQDLRVMKDGKTLILADTGLFKFTAPSLIIFDIPTKTYRKLLGSHPSMRPQDLKIRTKDGTHSLAWGLVSFVVGLDGITLSADEQWLYYASMSHDTLYRIPTAALLDAELSESELAAKIEVVGKKPQSDGITTDPQGNILITDVENGGIARMDPQGQLQTLTKSPEVTWADGIVMHPDGRALFTDSAIPAYLDPLTRPPSPEILEAAGPYTIYQFKP
ncbi:MAG: SMP-30/gluconolactonase/LRE family protein [Trueperaceae bacterium]